MRSLSPPRDPSAQGPPRGPQAGNRDSYQFYLHPTDLDHKDLDPTDLYPTDLLYIQILFKIILY